MFCIMLPRFVQLGEYNLNKFTFCQIIEKWVAFFYNSGYTI